MRLFFFPALLPLGSLLPAFFALIGASAAAFHIIKRGASRRILIAFGVSILLACGLWTGHRAWTKSRLPVLNELEHLPALDTTASWTQLLPRTPLSDLVYSQRHALLIFGTAQGTLDAISTRDAILAFSLRLREPVVAAPLIHGDRLYVGEGLHEADRAALVAVHLPEGSPIWQKYFPGHVESAPTLSPDGKVLFGCAGQAGAYSVDAETGGLRWLRSIGHCDSTPLLHDDILFVLADSGLNALAYKTGDLIWRVPLPGSPWGTPVFDRTTGLLLMTTGTGQLGPEFSANEAGWSHAIDPKARRIAWSRVLSGIPLMQSELLALPSGNLTIHVLKKGEVTALRTRDGSTVWSRTLPSPVLSGAKIVPGTLRLWVLAYDGTSMQLDAADGRVIEKKRIDEGSTSGPVFAPPWAFLATKASVSAFRLDSRGSRQ